MPTTDTLETPLHLAAKFNNIKIFEHILTFFKDNNSLLQALSKPSLRGWKPLDLVPGFSNKFHHQKKKYLKLSMKSYLLPKKDSFNSLLCSKEKLKGYDVPFVYCIIGNQGQGRGSDVVGGLLANIAARVGHLEGFAWRILEGFEKEEEAQNEEEKNLSETENGYLIYLITVEKDLARVIASGVNETMYNCYLNYHTHYNEEMFANYEPFRDTQLQGNFLLQLTKIYFIRVYDEVISARIRHRSFIKRGGDPGPFPCPSFQRTS